MEQKQIRQIPVLAQGGLTATQIAKKNGVHVNTVYYWVKRLRAEGTKVEWTKVGRKPLEIN